jgi:hypothetical protein
VQVHDNHKLEEKRFHQMNNVIMDGRERGIQPADLALAFLGAARDVLAEEAGPAVAAMALLAALDALRQQEPEAVQQALEASAAMASKSDLQ